VAVYSPTSFTGSMSMSLRSTLWPSFSRASAIWRLFTEPKIVPVALVLAPMVSLTSAMAAARASASALILASCAPAFADLMIEALGDAGVEYGLDRKMAYTLAAKMLVGTGGLYLEKGLHPGAMKDAVCSPKGMTIKGVTTLEKRGFRASLIEAVEAIEES